MLEKTLLSLAVFGASCFFLTGRQCLAEEATMLVQDSTVSGHQIIYITDHALKIDNQKVGATILCTAPDWNVYIYNRRSQSYFETPADKFSASFFQALTQAFGAGLRQQTWVKDGTETIAAVPAIRYVCHPKATDDIKLRRCNVVKAQYWIATKFALPPKVYHVISNMDSLPLLPGLPLQVNFTGEDKIISTTLSTKSSKKVLCSPSDFAKPKDFKKAKSEREVFIDPAGQSAIEDMFR